MSRLGVLRLLLLLPIVGVASTLAGDRLSALSREDSRDDYYVILRKVFHRIYRDDVVVAAICAVGTGADEHATGILRVNGGYAAFSAFPSASVWSTEYDRFMADGRETCFDAATRKEVPCPPQDRTGLPKSYRSIKTEMKTRPLPNDLARRITALWRHRVREALHAPILSDWERGALGGLVHYYFVRSGSGDWASVIGSKGDDKSDAAQMADLAIALQGYAVGAVSATGLGKALSIADARRPNHAMERTADRPAFTFEMISTPSPRATRATVRRRSSYSR